MASNPNIEVCRQERAKAPSGSETDDPSLRLLPRSEFDDPALADVVREKLRQALDDPRPAIPLADAYERIAAQYREDMKRLGREP